MNKKDIVFIKDNWSQTKKHFIDWWAHKGLVVGSWESGVIEKNTVRQVGYNADEISLNQRYTDVCWRARNNLFELNRRNFPLDTLPFFDTDIGPGSLCIYLGCEPDFAEDTVWYHSCITDSEKESPIIFDEHRNWWKTQELLIKKCVNISGGNYFVGIPDITEGLDVLSSMRGAEQLMMDMMDNPNWVKQRLEEIESAYFEVYHKIYNMVYIQDEGCVYRAFSLWSPGRVAKIQCDMAAMLSPSMFREFSLPYLERQCSWLDHSMFHLDGTQCIVHLDALLDIEYLDAIEWTPQAGIPDGADAQWHDMYRKILLAGKSVQVVGVKPKDILPLIDAIGTDGVYIMVQLENENECEIVLRQIEGLRR